MDAVILNVDDREVNRYIRSQVLRAAGYRVVEAATGAEALALCEQTEPHLVLLDVNLPDMSGLEVCRRIKSAPGSSAVVVIHISATAVNSAAQARGLAEGADGYVTEPIEPDLLVAHVRALLRLRSAEERAHESDQRFSTVFAEAPIGMLLVTPDLRVVQANAAAVHLLGHSEPLQGQLLAALFPAAEARTAEAIAEFFAGGSGRYQAETRLLRRQAERVPVKLTASLVRDRRGALRYGILLLEDITQRLADAEALQRSFDDLNQFAYAASHDLQEPLRTITSYTQLLARRYGPQLEPEALLFTDFIVSGTQRMQALISDLLALSQLQSEPQREPQPTDAGAALQMALTDLRMMVEDTQARVIVEPLPVVLASSGQLVQLFQNLVGNSMKYRRPGVAPEIRVLARREDGEWMFTVRDNGMGFDPQHAERIFGVFRRLHGHEIPGTGIGLSLCRRIVERSGGRIWAEAAPGEGASFYFTLPAVPEEQAAGA